jgi:nitroimidazol reductase NimA-like FMN-containing flavoprotein (pyridoxamine 5'-phosphate oxidase superfamily)
LGHDRTDRGIEVDSLTRDEAVRFLNDAPVAHIGVISRGLPYVTPMSFVLDGDRILFRTKPGRRFEAILENPQVSIEASQFDNEGGDWLSVIASGTAAETTDQDTAALTVQLLLRKYEAAIGSPLTHGGLQPMSGFPHIVEVKITEITGMSSGRGFSARTRPGRL